MTCRKIDVQSTLKIADLFTSDVLSQLSFILDFLTSGWVFLVFLILFGLLPLVAFPQVSLPSLSSRIVGAFVRTITTIAIGSILWAKLGLFTWLTAVLVYLTGLGIGWLGSHQWRSGATLQQLGQQIAIATVDIFDRGLSWGQLFYWLLLPWQSIYQLCQKRFNLSNQGQGVHRTVNSPQQQHWSLPLIFLTTITMIGILGLTVWYRFKHPLTEFRFSHPDLYGQLLIAQQILARDLPPVNYLPIFPSLAAFLTALSGVHPVQVIHMLGGILGTLLVLSVGYTIRSLTQNTPAALAATYSLGAYLFTWHLPTPMWLPPSIQQWLSLIKENLNDGLIKSWAPSNLEVGAIFVLLMLGCSTHLVKLKQRKAALINTTCCGLLVLTIAPSLFILVLFGGFGLIFGRQIALFTLTTAWIILGSLAAIPDGRFSLFAGILTTLPIGLSLFVGMLFIAIASVGKLLLADWSAPVCLTVLLAVTLNFCLPAAPQINYVEYDAAARKTVEISNLFPHRTWTVVAPIEQLSQVYGRGWYQDLGDFVTKYQNLVGNPNFQFPSQTSLLIFAEKLPFISDRPEFPVPYSVLLDPTYRNYRSPSGRAKLAQATLKLCQTYHQHHPDSSIYYEDRYLRIYHFPAL